MSCEHLNFTANVKVTRLTSEEGGPVTGYTTDITVNCHECGLPFTFVGVPGGYSPSQPMVNVDGTTLRAPIIPSMDPVDQFNSIIKQSQT